MDPFKKTPPPEYDVLLPEQLSSDSRLFLNRVQMLRGLGLNAAANIVELGVDEGKFSKEILKEFPAGEISLVDTWASKRYSDAKHNQVVALFRSNKNAKIIMEDSTNAASFFDSQSVDMVYLDTSHTFRNTLRELPAWKDKVKTGGFLCGHDFTEGNWEAGFRYGVQQAVLRFLRESTFEFCGITADLSEGTSFSLRAR